MYDGGEHNPKLMPCSHTVCIQCLDRIVATFARDTGQFRCPICRELITIPRGGVQALPPSFLVNQLLDLMARQRREVIPKCSTHHNQVGFILFLLFQIVIRSNNITQSEMIIVSIPNILLHSQELLFCETCDTVFCTLCTGGTHKPSPNSDSGIMSQTSTSLEKSNSPTLSSKASLMNANSIAVINTADHTVIPFSVAIKRMSEILIYKANECTAKVDILIENTILIIFGYYFIALSYYLYIDGVLCIFFS